MRAVNVPGWANVPVGRILEESSRLPVAIERSDGLEALGEAAFGAGRGARNLLYVSLRMEGVGGGVVEEGRLIQGRFGSAGEIGHVSVSEGGPVCGCGLRGCLEAHVAPQRMVARWRARTKADLPSSKADLSNPGEGDFLAMLEAERAGDRASVDVLRKSARLLARGIGSAVNLLNAERVVLGGLFVQAGDLILEQVKAALPDYTMKELLDGLEVRLAELGDDAAALGLVARVRQAAFAYPASGLGCGRKEGAR
jgi:glucokinase